MKQLRFCMGGYSATLEGYRLCFWKGEDVFLSVPLAVRVNEEVSAFSQVDMDGDKLILAGENQSLEVAFYNRYVTVSYQKQFSMPTPLNQVSAFYGGIELQGFDRAFCPQARHNGHNNLDWFSHLPDISSNGYFTPPILQFSIGSKDGYASFGLLDIPDTKQCRLQEDMTFLVQHSGGHIQTTDYQMPRIVIYFPDDEWKAISQFRQILIEQGAYVPAKKPFSQVPDWWKDPMICIYGDQLLAENVGKGIDQAWVESLLSSVEQDWELEHFNFVIDDSWQMSHSMTPVVDTERFPDLRGMIDGLHSRGCHVLLWMTPLMDKITNGFETNSQKMGVISDQHCESKYYDAFPGTYYLDYTAEKAEEFLAETARYLFSNEPGCLNADGVKLDFLADHRDPVSAQSYQNPQAGIGMREMLRFYQMFYTQVKKVKPDAIVDATVGDPRFEQYVDMNRMHDTHSGNLEKTLRVRVSTLACPNLIVDSDGALMFKNWLKAHYIDAAIYGICANYYTMQYQDHRMAPGDYSCIKTGRIPVGQDETYPEEKKQLGRLFSMVRNRPDGVAEHTGNGWRLVDNGQVNALSMDGTTVVYYPTEKNLKGYIFTFRDEAIEIPLCGRKIGRLSHPVKNGNLQVDYARDRVLAHFVPGVVYSFENVDEGDSISGIFQRQESVSAEQEVNYVN